MRAGRSRFFTMLFSILATLLFTQSAYTSDEFEFRAKLRGSEEAPEPVDTRTRGEARFEVNKHFTKIHFRLRIKKALDILAVAGAHIHCAPAGENGPVVAFLAGPVAGGFDDNISIQATLSDDNITDVGCGANIAELVQAMADGMTYVNVHSAANPGGEIRGQIMLDDD